MNFQIKEELRRVYVLYRDDLVWRIYGTEAEAKEAIVNINLNMQRLTTRTVVSEDATKET
jgi:hypothetical protein